MIFLFYLELTLAGVQLKTACFLSRFSKMHVWNKLHRIGIHSIWIMRFLKKWTHVHKERWPVNNEQRCNSNPSLHHFLFDYVGHWNVTLALNLYSDTVLPFDEMWAVKGAGGAPAAEGLRMEPVCQTETPTHVQPGSRGFNSVSSLWIVRFMCAPLRSRLYLDEEQVQVQLRHLLPFSQSNSLTLLFFYFTS